MSAAYPSSVLSWTSRVNSQTAFAADPNTLAAEIDAIEKYVGVNPQIESSARTGATKNFSTLSARVSDAMLQNGHPYVEVARTSNYKIYHNTKGTTHTTQNYYNITRTNWPNYVSPGGVITIRDAGIWLINVYQVWDYAQHGWVEHILYGNGQMRDSVYNYSMFPGSGSNAYGERAINKYGNTESTFVGRLSAGTKITVTSGNFTNKSPLQMIEMSLSCYFLRP